MANELVERSKYYLRIARQFLNGSVNWGQDDLSFCDEFEAELTLGLLNEKEIQQRLGNLENLVNQAPPAAWEAFALNSIPQEAAAA